MEKTKSSKLLITIISVLLATIFAITLSLTLIGTKANADTYTVYDDGEYYSETTYYLTESAYNKSLKETKADTADTKSVTKSAVSSKDDDSDFVIAATKKVGVYEAADENGNIIESRLLKKSEIEKLNNIPESSNGIAPFSYRPLDKFPDENKLDSDGYSFNYLYIQLKVSYGNESGQYVIRGFASWEQKLVGVWESNKAAEESYLDFLGISWGGNGNLTAIDKSISGKYYNDNDITYGRTIDEVNCGYVWEFYEKSGFLGKEMAHTTAYVTIDNKGIFHNRTTNARLTYIHTYGKIGGELKLTASNDDSIAAELTLSETKSSWETIINIPNILY